MYERALVESSRMLAGGIELLVEKIVVRLCFNFPQKVCWSHDFRWSAICRTDCSKESLSAGSGTFELRLSLVRVIALQNSLTSTNTNYMYGQKCPPLLPSSVSTFLVGANFTEQ